MRRRATVQLLAGVLAIALGVLVARVAGAADEGRSCYGLWEELQAESREPRRASIVTAMEATCTTEGGDHRRMKLGIALGLIRGRDQESLKTLEPLARADRLDSAEAWRMLAWLHEEQGLTEAAARDRRDCEGWAKVDGVGRGGGYCAKKRQDVVARANGTEVSQLLRILGVLHLLLAAVCVRTSRRRDALGAIVALSRRERLAIRTRLVALVVGACAMAAGLFAPAIFATVLSAAAHATVLRANRGRLRQLLSGKVPGYSVRAWRTEDDSLETVRTSAGLSEPLVVESISTGSADGTYRRAARTSVLVLV